MEVRVRKVAAKNASGLAKAGAVITTGETAMGAPEIALHISAFDCYDIPSVVANLYLSLSEAKQLGERLIAACKPRQKAEPSKPIHISQIQTQHMRYELSSIIPNEIGSMSDEQVRTDYQKRFGEWFEANPNVPDPWR